MFPFFVAKESGKSISSDNLAKLQSVHDTVQEMGAACGKKGMESLARSMEAALPMNTSHDALRGHLRKALMSAHGVSNTYDSSGPWIMDTFPSHVIYQHNGDTLKRPYTITHGGAGTEPTIKLGTHKKVHTAYMDSAESSAAESMRVSVELGANFTETVEFFSLAKTREDVIITLPEGCELVRESAVFFVPEGNESSVGEWVKEAAAKKTTIPICIIKPGWGSSAYYSKEVIQKTGPVAFPKGTQMFMNHATDMEEALRPEGDMNSLAAVLAKAAYWDDNGPKGPALYSEAILFSDHADKVLEKGPYTGCSINAAIKAHEGTVDGRTGKVADAFVKGYSVDFVTKAGAGGAPIVPVTESAGGGAPIEQQQQQQQENTMNEQERIAALEAENNTLKGTVRTLEAEQVRVLALGTVATILRESGVTIKSSLLERVCINPTMKEGKIDPKWAEEVAADLVGMTEGQGRVTGQGERRTSKNEDEDKGITKSLEAGLKRLGVPEAGLAYAMYGTEAGRGN